jgi:hypothetical protein
MAQKVQTLFIDDLDGSEAEGTVRFGLDGAEYEIDLNAQHAGALRKALARYIDASPVHRRFPAQHRNPAVTAERTAGERQRAQHHRGPRLGQVTRHRGQGPRTDTSRADRQVQGGHSEVDRLVAYGGALAGYRATAARMRRHLDARALAVGVPAAPSGRS